MFRNKYTRIFHSMLLLLLAIKFVFINNNELVLDVGYTSNDLGQPIEIDLDNQIYYLNKSINLIDGKTLTNYQGYQTITNVLNKEKGLIISTKEFIIANDKKNNPDFTFIPLDNKKNNFVFYELDDYHFGVGIQNKKDNKITTINYNAYNNLYLKKSRQIIIDDYYPLYEIEKINLDSTNQNNFILYNIDDITINNDFKDINYKEQFIWKSQSHKSIYEFIS